MNPLPIPRESTTCPRPAAASPPLGPGYSVVLLPPPYRPDDLRPTTTDAARASAPPGLLVGVRLTRPRARTQPLLELVQELSRQVPWSPVVVLLDLPLEESLAAIARLAPLPLRAVALIGEPLPSILREVLTDPATPPTGVVEWLRARPIRLNPGQVELLERLFALAPKYADVSRLLDAARIPFSSTRFRLHKRRLPPPGQWFQLARALHAALLLQRHPELSAVAAAHRLGFADHSALVHLLRRRCGAGARLVHYALGWEPGSGQAHECQPG
jgi:AraC-like DNA-binding protein